MVNLRPAILSGSWYPANPQQLRSLVGEYMAGADPAARPPGRPVLIIVPHAGYSYSGPTAGRLYGLLKGTQYHQVFVLAPSHRTPLRQVVLTSAEAFSTPLGQVPVAIDTVQELAALPGFSFNDGAHAVEHAVEIQLPFLQEVFGDSLRIVPMLVPELPESQRHQAAAALAPWCKGDSLFLVSSDFTHYGTSYGYVPFRDRVAERLRELDSGAIDRILARDPEGLLNYAQRTGITMCGVHAAAFALSAPLPTGGEAVLVSYNRSGDRDADYTLSVSYASLLLTGMAGDQHHDVTPAAAGDPARSSAMDLEHHAGSSASDVRPPGPDALGAAEKRFLLLLARQVITAVVEGTQPPSPEEVARDQDLTLSSRLLQKRGAFVTLTSGGRLRGCIGYIEGIKPLAQAVADNAASAASRDPRFRPVSTEEVESLQIEISTLTPLRPIAGPQDIIIGVHGIVLHKGPAQAVFLPQVAPEQGWDRDTTLDHLARKAGLPEDGWRQGARFEVFEAEVFQEDRP